MHPSSTTVVVMALVALSCNIFKVEAQDSSLADRSPPAMGQLVNIMYSRSETEELGTVDAQFNTCFRLEGANRAPADYAYLTFAPKNATINFYTDGNCQDFTYGLYGYYIGNPGPAMSFRWVGWTEDAVGVLVEKEPIHGQGDAAHGGGVPSTGNTPHPDGNDNNNHSNNGGGEKSYLSTFFGAIVGSLITLLVGGIIFWSTVQKGVDDSKFKRFIPSPTRFKRASPGGRGEDNVGDRDDDILLATKNRDENAFELIGDDDDEDESEADHTGSSSEGSTSSLRRQQRKHSKEPKEQNGRYQNDERV
ncbi:hypothetical protein BCR41DRAFT_353628 [Lobosporangium transversale]|uniref:STM1-like N-terminal domain-containing protein n=1 Tax=Lobosporangium transversale TaxID=64571 RepID=A0A1Y2GPR4_9FUNG|nr:hypothetical protein BCR41DRAFT_353628 [Lobosporangium transversale]ORZ16172.1 hypothetical protein BCR41DRAFT_353628 [Lobosporangium transversale]|eukprot:XP_021881519.1 hypothetical protein BCR41DRAFT_353628 [Lobosporangium transversale]